MKTVYCVECMQVLRRFFVEVTSTEDLLGGVCPKCQGSLKKELDHARRLLHEAGQMDLSQVGNRLDCVRRALHEREREKEKAMAEVVSKYDLYLMQAILDGTAKQLAAKRALKSGKQVFKSLMERGLVTPHAGEYLLTPEGKDAYEKHPVLNREVTPHTVVVWRKGQWGTLVSARRNAQGAWLVSLPPLNEASETDLAYLYAAIAQVHQALLDPPSEEDEEPDTDTGGEEA